MKSTAIGSIIGWSEASNFCQVKTLVLACCSCLLCVVLQCTRCGDLIKRAQNRAPSQTDCFQKAGRGSACINEHCHWHNHQQRCGGDYEKVAEPEGYKDRRPKSRSRYNDKTVEQKKDNLRKNKDALGNVKGDKSKNTEGYTSGQMQKGVSLEMYYTINNREREKLVTATTFGEICVNDSNENEMIEKKSKKRRRNRKGDETEEDGQQSDGANNFERVIVQKDDCTVIIGWKNWYAYESEEDEENTKALDSKRRRRQMPERARCQIQNCCSRVCVVQDPVASNRLELNSGEIKALSNDTPRQPWLKNGNSGFMPLDFSLKSHSVNCSSTMLTHTEKAENLSFSYAAAEKDSPREPGILAFACSTPGPPGTLAIACSSPGEPGTLTIACENTSTLVSSCQETAASASAKQTSVIDFGNVASEDFANIKECETSTLNQDGPKLLVTECRTEEALLVDELEGEVGEGFGGKITRKGRSKRLRKIGGLLGERGPSAACPICQTILSGDIKDANFNHKFNEHIDACMGTLGT